VFGQDIASGAEGNKFVIVRCKSSEDVLSLVMLKPRLKALTPHIPHDAIKTISHLPKQYPGLMTNNEAFHRMLTEGIRIIYKKL